MKNKREGKIPIYGIIWFGIVIGFISGLWADMLYEKPFLIGTLSAIIFYIIYASIWYLLVYNKKEKK